MSMKTPTGYERSINLTAGTMEAIKEYLRTYYVVMTAPLAYIIRNTITVQAHGDYPMYAITKDEMIDRMLQLPPDKNKLLPEKDAQTVQAHTAECVIDNKLSMTFLIRSAKTLTSIHVLTAYVQEGWQRGILHHPFQVARHEPCQHKSIRSQDGFTDIYI